MLSVVKTVELFYTDIYLFYLFNFKIIYLSNKAYFQFKGKLANKLI